MEGVEGSDEDDDGEGERKEAKVSEELGGNSERASQLGGKGQHRRKRPKESRARKKWKVQAGGRSSNATRC